MRLGPSQGSEGDREGPPHLGPSGPRPPAQVGTPSATAQRPSAARQSHSFSVHRGTALISSPMASPFSRGTSAWFPQPASSGLQVSDEWSHALPPPSFRAPGFPGCSVTVTAVGPRGQPPPAGLLPSRLRGEGTSSFLSGTNEIFLLLCAPLGSGSVFYPLGLALCSGPVITAHTSSRTGLALRAGWAPLHRPLPEAPPGTVGVSSLPLLVPRSAWRPLT